MLDDATLRAGLAEPLEASNFEGLGALYRGKVRDCYRRGDELVLVTTDRVSAFDRVLGTLPFKGQVLSRLAVFWFERTAAVAPNHLRAAPDPSVMLATACEPLPVELVVRAYLTGVTATSVWTAYAAGARSFCGHPLPEGMKKNEPLPRPIVTPSTKAPKGGHDRSVSADELVRDGVVARDELERASALALALFDAGARHCEARGLVLADTKYEFGRAPDGSLVVIDEVHTPDSSRFWFAESYEARLRAGAEPESFDKEPLRRWLVAQGYAGEGAPPPLPDALRCEAARRYVEVYERLSGEPFVPALGAPAPRIARALGLAR